MLQITSSKRFSLLLYGGIVFTLLILLWPVFMGLSQLDGSMEERITSLTADATVHKLNFFIASLIAPALVLILTCLALFFSTKKETPVLNVLGMLFLAPYLALVTVAYSSQYILLPALLNDGRITDAYLWYFENPNSVIYFLDQLGYVFFALSACVIGWKYLFERGLWNGSVSSSGHPPYYRL